MDNQPFLLAGHTIQPGTKEVVLFPAPNINTQTKIDIPVHVFHGKKAGPKIFVTGVIHGDELNGIEIIRRLHKLINVKKLHGTVITVPVVNIHGVIIQERYMSDRRDLNRSFPGAKKGTLASRLAYGLMKNVVSHCDFGIDLHTGALGRTNIPQLRVDFTTKHAKAFAKSFDIPIILHSKQRDGSLRQAASRLGIPVVVYEGGEALRYNELCVREGLRGIINAMRYLKMIQVGHKHKPIRSKSVITDTSRWVRAPTSGILVPQGNVISTSVKKGDIMAYVHDPFLVNPSIAVVAPFSGVVIGQSLRAMVTEGDALYHIASFQKVSGIEARIDEINHISK